MWSIFLWARLDIDNAYDALRFGYDTTISQLLTVPPYVVASTSAYCTVGFEIFTDTPAVLQLHCS